MANEDLTTRMRQLELAWKPPLPEEEDRVLRILEVKKALDLAPMLGLKA